MLVIFPIVFYFLNTTSFPQADTHQMASDSGYVIYLVKISWHTGIIFRTDQVDRTIWKSLNDFDNYNYVDVGWGDKDFYQTPGFDINLAVRALFMKTESTLRVAGINRPIDNYIKFTDYAEKLILSRNEYDRLCEFIQSTYNLKNNHSQILSEQLNGAVKFYLRIYSGFLTILPYLAV
ncbi:MAG TPA: DUF2459 domain-containing protein, partial [Ignavibacteriaceae bacterium]|nr:DUF2459 domain-containing protein [Ignavibacteriaceae bacterium]